MKKLRKVLIIDDSEVILRLAGTALEAAGYDVVTRSSPFGTGAAILRHQPDLVLVDACMPALSGEDVVKHVRGREALRGTLVVLYSSCPVDELKTIAERCHADGFLHKTADMTALVSQVDELLSHRPAPATQPANADAENGPMFRILFVDDDAQSLRSLARIFKHWKAAEYLTSARAALARAEALGTPDLIVADLVMPDLSGEEFYYEATRKNPNLSRRFVFMTGQLNNQGVTEFLAQTNAPVVYKPFSPARLQEVVEQVLARPAA